MNKELKSVPTWFKANKVYINTDKTKWNIFHTTSKKLFMSTKNLELIIDGITLSKKQSLSLCAYLLMKMSREKYISTQLLPRFLKVNFT